MDRPVDLLCSIPAWGVIAGACGGYRFFDPVTLQPVSQPRALTEAGYRAESLHPVVASSDGRFAAVGIPLPAEGTSRPPTDLTVYDFRHPLAPILRPIASLDEADLSAISRAEQDQAGKENADDERQVLRLLHAVVQHRISARRANTSRSGGRRVSGNLLNERDAQ
ncbi:MAG: hypothetical protein ACRDN0_11730 [Trebonia sp.]